MGDHAPDVDRYARKFLSTNERAHLEGYRIRASAERYVVTRSLVRAVLGERLGLDPAAIPVSRTDTGKPIVTGGIHFNVSHSGDLILLGLCERRQVGIDVERKREVGKVDALSRRWLSEDEKRQAAQLLRHGATASDAFLRIWSLKEAKLKALGVGISGAAFARMDTVEALPLDELLDPLAQRHADDGYVGAIAFA